MLPGASYVVTISGPQQPIARRVGSLEYHVFNPDSRAESVEILLP